MGREQTTKAPTGIKIREWSSGRKTLMIQFNYKNVQCRESLHMEATKNNINYAVRLRGEILNSIAKNQFNYVNFFPNSKKAIQFGHRVKYILVRDLLDQFIFDAKKRLANSSYIRMERSCKTHLYSTFGSMYIQDLKGQAINEWIRKLNCSRKTINNILWPLRAVVDLALLNDYIDINPFDKVKLNKILGREQKTSRFVIDPFLDNEINAILSKAEGQIKTLYQFAFYTGLRPSELMGLRWGDIDWINNTARISDTIVDKLTKGPKTLSGYREIMLLSPALQALKAQKKYTFLAGIRVFQNPLTNQPWETSQQLRRTAWMPLLKLAGIRYRNPYQTRHTYASMMLSRGENLMWLSKQMGHADSNVTLRRYARWIPDTTTASGYETRHDWGNHTDHCLFGVG